MKEDILEAVRSGNETVIKLALAPLDSMSGTMLDMLLSHSPSEKVSDYIKKIFTDLESERKKTASVAMADENSLRKQPMEEEKPETKPEAAKSPATDAASDEDAAEQYEDYGQYEDFTEEQALRKYRTGNAKVDKSVQMLLSAFKQNVGNINNDKACKLSSTIATYVYRRSQSTFPKEIRSKVHNLKENRKLCIDIYSMRTTAVQFAEMNADDMKSEEIRIKDAEALKDSLLSAQVAKATADTEIFQCSRCKERKCTYYQLQTRSCDEPMTTFVTCTVCGNRWRF